MKNKEKYFDFLVEMIGNGDGLAVEKHSFEPAKCAEINCSDCLFYDFVKCEYDRRKDWLNAEYKEPAKLTNDEIAVLKNIDKQWKWIAREKVGALFIYDIKPRKITSHWTLDYGVYVELPIKNLFKFIKWEDENPYEIDELLKMNGVER